MLDEHKRLISKTQCFFIFVLYKSKCNVKCCIKRLRIIFVSSAFYWGWGASNVYLAWGLLMSGTGPGADSFHSVNSFCDFNRSFESA